jgi:hypothetical protein
LPRPRSSPFSVSAAALLRAHRYQGEKLWRTTETGSRCRRVKTYELFYIMLGFFAVHFGIPLAADRSPHSHSNEISRSTISPSLHFFRPIPSSGSSPQVSLSFAGRLRSGSAGAKLNSRSRFPGKSSATGPRPLQGTPAASRGMILWD